MTRAQSIAACCTLSSCRRGVKTSLTTECRSSTGQILGWSPAHDHLGAGGSTSSWCGGRSLGWSPGTDHQEPTRTTSWAILEPEPRREPPSASFLASTANTSDCPVALPIGPRAVRNPGIHRAGADMCRATAGVRQCRGNQRVRRRPRADRRHDGWRSAACGHTDAGRRFPRSSRWHGSTSPTRTGVADTATAASRSVVAARAHSSPPASSSRPVIRRGSRIGSSPAAGLSCKDRSRVVPNALCSVVTARAQRVTSSAMARKTAMDSWSRSSKPPSMLDLAMTTRLTGST